MLLVLFKYSWAPLKSPTGRSYPLTQVSRGSPSELGTHAMCPVVFRTLPFCPGPTTV